MVWCQLAAVDGVAGLVPALIQVLDAAVSPPEVVAEAMAALANLTQLPGLPDAAAADRRWCLVSCLWGAEQTQRGWKQ